MKLKLLTLSMTLLLISGCSTTFNNYYGNFKSECRNLPDNYINESHIKEYNKAKSIYFEDKKKGCHACTLLSQGERWNDIEVYLLKSERGFPFENEGLYKIYRNYKLNNCIKIGITDPVFYENNKGKFCLSADKIKERTSMFSYSQQSKTLSETKTSVSTIYITTIKYKNEYVIKNHGASFNSSSLSDSCEKKDKGNKLLSRDFSYW